MELDDLKHAWQTLDHRLDQQYALQLHLLRTTHLDRARVSLRSLVRAARLQLVVGVVLTVALASHSLADPGSPPQLICSLALLLYTFALALSAVRELLLLAGITYDAPIVAIQTRLAALRSWRIRSTLWIGLPWWFLWIPVQILGFAALGLDLVAHAPLAVAAELAVCVAGFLLSLAVYRWARRAGHPRLAAALERVLAGRSLERAASELAEITRFTRA